MHEDFISAPEAEAQWPGRRKAGAAFIVDPDNNRWDVARSALDGAFERIEGYRRRGMRVSTDKTDPGYTGVPTTFRVTHDGKTITNWVIADSVEGRVVCYGIRGGPTVIAEDDPTRSLTFELPQGEVAIARI